MTETRRLCAASKTGSSTTGGTCHHYAIAGSDYCAKHGGVTPQVNPAAGACQSDNLRPGQGCPHCHKCIAVPIPGSDFCSRHGGHEQVTQRIEQMTAQAEQIGRALNALLAYVVPDQQEAARAAGVEQLNPDTTPEK